MNKRKEQGVEWKGEVEELKNKRLQNGEVLAHFTTEEVNYFNKMKEQVGDRKEKLDQ